MSPDALKLALVGMWGKPYGHSMLCQLIQRARWEGLGPAHWLANGWVSQENADD